MSYSKLEVRSISQVAADTEKFIVDRKEGRAQSLKVKSAKINKTFLGGFDWGRILSVAGLSGSGKSTLVRQFVREMLTENDQDFEVLSFQFEMLGVDEVARDLSAELEIPVKELYSAENPISEELQKKVSEALTKIQKLPIHIVDVSGTVSQIRDTILDFINTRIKGKDKGIVVTIDHTLLVRKEDRADDKAVIDELMFMLVSLKKVLASLNIKAFFIVISQLNRAIESPERVNNPRLHFPNKNDLYGASSIYNGSDYVIIANKPCAIDGIGNWYGPPSKRWKNGLPVYNPSDPSQPLIYLHVIKERFGNPSIIAMADDLKFGRISEFHYQSSQ